MNRSFLSRSAPQLTALLGGLMLLFVSVPSASAAVPGATARLKVLFLGDSGKHESAQRMADLAPPMLDRNIEIVYTEDAEDLLSSTLGGYNAILVYGDQTELPAPQEAALLEFVSNGGGLLAVHTGGMNFPKSKAWAQLIGARSQHADAKVFTTKTLAPQHPLMAGAEPFESQDSPLVHTDQVQAGRTVLSQRVDGNGKAENWTWVREHGKGRVFYTGWGHDYHTWIHPGFIDLMERGIRWTSGQDVPAVLAKRPLHKPFAYQVAKVPYLAPRGLDHPNIKKTWPEMQLPLSPAESMKRMITPAGFEVRLFAAEPNIRKVIAMTWDERGRLWVAETQDYPNEIHPGTGSDRISICEDTDGDGEADKFTVFADNLNIPTALTLANGGLIVATTAQTLFLQDTNGDDKADVRKILFEGWGLKDTHAGPNSFFYGLDNRIWGTVGYSGFKGEVGGKNFSFDNGLYSFNPAGTDMEFVAQGFRNMRGIGFTEDGDYFGTGANGAPSLCFEIPMRYFEMILGSHPGSPHGTYRSARGLPVFRNFRQWDGYGIYTAGVGHYVYTARTYPPEYWNKVAFVNEPTLGVVGSFKLKDTGTFYQTHNPSNLLASDDEWFSPILSEVGPDGSVWVLDWYNFIIQHNPTPGGFKTGIGNAYISEARDKSHARIYRIVYTGAKPGPAVSLAKATPAQLVAMLAHPNLLWRGHAQRLLVERAKSDVVPAIVALLDNKEVDSVGGNVGAIHATWTLQGLHALDAPGSPAFAAVVRALKHPAPGVRRNAALALPASPASLAALLDSGIFSDKEIRVRLAAFKALAGQAPSDETSEAVFAFIERGYREGQLRQAALAAAAAHFGIFLAHHPVASVSPELRKIIELLTKKKTVPAVDPNEKRVHLTLQVVVGKMKYTPDRLKVKAGEKVRFTFQNTDMMEHNVIILKPGTMDKVGALADKMAASPTGAARDYVPASPDVLWSTPVLDPGKSHEILFDAPTTPGQYPFICTFPGHWRIMQGVLTVEPAG